MADPLTEAEIERMRAEVVVSCHPETVEDVDRLLASLAEARARVASLEARVERQERLLRAGLGHDPR